jgi:hypothetical protein
MAHDSLTFRFAVVLRGVANPSGVLAPDDEEAVSPTLGYLLRC